MTILLGDDEARGVFFCFAFLDKPDNGIERIKKAQIGFITIHNPLAIPSSRQCAAKHRRDVAARLHDGLHDDIIAFTTRERKMIIAWKQAFAKLSHATRVFCVVVKLNVGECFHETFPVNFDRFPRKVAC